MSAVDVKPARAGALASALGWTGRGLSAIAGTFCAAEGVARLAVERSLVAGAAPLHGFETLAGGALVTGVLLTTTGRSHVAGAAVLASVLIGLVIAESRTAPPSPDHLLFWLYVAAMAVAGSVLRRASPQS